MSRHPSQEDLAAYAIGGLDGREERVVAKHLDRCEECATELAEKYGPAVAVLAESVEQVEPPPELRQSLMATVRGGGGSGAARPGPDAPAPLRWQGFLLRPAAGLAAVALVGGRRRGLPGRRGRRRPTTETIASRTRVRRRQAPRRR